MQESLIDKDPSCETVCLFVCLCPNPAAERRQLNVVEGSDVRGHRLIAASADILLGKVVVPLLALLTRTTGSS